MFETVRNKSFYKPVYAGDDNSDDRKKQSSTIG